MKEYRSPFPRDLIVYYDGKLIRFVNAVADLHLDQEYTDRFITRFYSEIAVHSFEQCVVQELSSEQIQQITNAQIQDWENIVDQYRTQI